MGHGDRVVDRRPVPAVALAGGTARRSGAGRRTRRRPACRSAVQPVDVGVEEQRLVGDVEADHRDRQAAAEHDPRRLRVHPDVELGGRRPVALAHRRRPSGRCARSSAPGRARPAAAGRCWSAGPVGISVTGSGRRLERRPQERERALGPDLGARLREVGAVEPALAVDVVGDLERPHERGRGARPRPARPCRPSSASDPQRVARRLAQPDVAADGRDRRAPRAPGRASASVIASASSWPGSQSSRTGMAAVTAGSRTRRPAAPRTARGR